MNDEVSFFESKEKVKVFDGGFPNPILDKDFSENIISQYYLGSISCFEKKAFKNMSSMSYGDIFKFEKVQKLSELFLILGINMNTSWPLLEK